MREGSSLADVGRTLTDVYAGSGRKAAKIFAMGFYQGLERYDGQHDDHRIGQLSSAARTLDGHIETLLSTSESFMSVSKDIRDAIGDVHDRPVPAYSGDDALLPYVQSFVTSNNLVGENFIALGVGLINRLEALRTVKGDSSNGKYLREFKEIQRYLHDLAGDRS